MKSTFWKTEEDVSAKPLSKYKLLPIGPTTTVSKTILSIPKMHVFFSDKTFDGYVTLLWEVDQGLVLNFKDEPEFGEGGAFSILIADRDRVNDYDFFRLYVQLFERLGLYLLEEKQFIPPRDFKRRFCTGR
jgi:hypothetical protein